MRTSRIGSEREDPILQGVLIAGSSAQAAFTLQRGQVDGGVQLDIVVIERQTPDELNDPFPFAEIGGADNGSLRIQLHAELGAAVRLTIARRTYGLLT